MLNNSDFIVLRLTKSFTFALLTKQSMRIFVFIGLLFISFSVFAQKNEGNWQQLSYVPVKVNELVHDFGKIEQYKKQKFKFIVVNDSIQPFFIKDVTTSCGCTSTAFTKKPIAQGKQGIIKIEFDAARPGVFSKSAFIYHNFGFKSIKLQIKGEVIPKAEKLLEVGTTNKQDNASK